MTPTAPGEWLTIERAIIETQLPLELLESAIQAGELPARRVCGARVVRRSEAHALALRIKYQARECEACE